eukprot:scaffold17804_cov34-Phaeocystis_antarctica.AAC.1
MQQHVITLSHWVSGPTHLGTRRPIRASGGRNWSSPCIAPAPGGWSQLRAGSDRCVRRKGLGSPEGPASHAEHGAHADSAVRSCRHASSGMRDGCNMRSRAPEHHRPGLPEELRVGMYRS